MFEEAKENHRSSDDVDDVSTLETPREEGPTGEHQTCLNPEGSGLTEDLNVGTDEHSVSETKDQTNCSPACPEITTSCEENVSETAEGGDSGEAENTSSRVDTHSDDVMESRSCEEQENQQPDVEENHLNNTESCPQQQVAQCVLGESSLDVSTPALSNTELQPEPEGAEQAEHDEGEEDMSSKCQAHSTPASGKKKRKKKRGKKKGGALGDSSQHKEKSVLSKDDEPAAEPDVDVSVSDTPKDSKMEQETEKVDGAEAVKASDTFTPTETPEESNTDHVTNDLNDEQTSETDQVVVEAGTTILEETKGDHVTEEHEEQSLETETAVETTETFSHHETLTEPERDLEIDEKDEGGSSETTRGEDVGSGTSPVPELILGSPDPPDDSRDVGHTDGPDEVCTSSVDNPQNETACTESETADGAEEPECTTQDPENTVETKRLENPDAETHAVCSDESECTESETTTCSDSKDTTPSEPPAATQPETTREDEEPRADTEHKDHRDDSEVEPDRTEGEELNEDLREAEGVVEPVTASCDERFDSCNGPTLSKNTDTSDTEERVDSGHTEESVTAVSSETNEIRTADALKAPESPEEATEAGCSVEQEDGAEQSAAPEDPEEKNSPTAQQSETQLCPEEQFPELSSDRSEDSSQPNLPDCEDDEDEEGQSFDFDDMDVEVAAVTNLPQTPNLEDGAEEAEVLSDDSSGSNVHTPGEPAETREVDTAEAAAPPLEDTVSEHVEHVENIPEEEVVVAEEPVVVAEELGGVAENINPAVKLKSEDLVVPKGADQTASSKDLLLQTKKDEKKNSKKGKAKGKEDCKMS